MKTFWVLEEEVEQLKKSETSNRSERVVESVASSAKPDLICGRDGLSSGWHLCSDYQNMLEEEALRKHVVR